MSDNTLFYERWLCQRELDEEAGLPRQPTPIEIWAPAFAWMPEFTVEKSFDSSNNKFCKICGLAVLEDKAGHLELHKQERELWHSYRQSVPTPVKRGHRVGEKPVERESFESWLSRSGESRRVTLES